MNQKKNLGQFFTTNCDYILQGFEQYVANKKVLDPFAGNGDLLQWSLSNGAREIIGYDIDQSLTKNHISFNNSLVSISYSDFIITNPPFLSKNKLDASQKSIMGNHDDLYLLALKKILDSGTPEGIIIIPVNFFSAQNSDDLRIKFLDTYQIDQVSYFTERVFQDTSYNIIVFHFIKKNDIDSQKILITTYPSKEQKTFLLEKKFKYRIAGEELSKIESSSSAKIIRLTEQLVNNHIGSYNILAFFNNKNNEQNYNVDYYLYNLIKSNIILLNCVDSNFSKESWIKASDIRSYHKDCLVGKKSSRSYAYLLLPDISLTNQEKIIPMFNQQLTFLREKYDSLFLTNFRDKNRKRISFEFCYQLISYCYNALS